MASRKRTSFRVDVNILLRLVARFYVMYISFVRDRVFQFDSLHSEILEDDERLDGTHFESILQSIEIRHNSLA